SFGSGLKHCGRRVWYSVNAISGTHITGVPVCSEYDADGWFGFPIEIHAIERSASRCVKRRDETAVHAMHQRLRFGVAQARIEFEDPRAIDCHHESGIEKATKRTSLRSHVFDCGMDHGVHHVARLILVQNAAVTVCAHAPGIRAFITVE